MKRSIVPRLVAFVALAGLAAHAQRQHQHPDPAQMVQHRVDFLTNQLGLSPTQQQQATTIFTSEMASAKALREQMKTAHQGLQDAVRNNDSAAIEQAAQAVGNLTAQSISGRAKAEAAFLQTLNAEQQTKYGQLHRRPGMPPGFGPRGPHSF